MTKPSFRLFSTRRTMFGLLGVLIGAGIFRGLSLGSLPPGVSGGEAAIGLSALASIHHATIPGFTPGDGYAPLWTLLQSLPIAIFGHTQLALRLVPAVIGLLSVIAVWLLAKDWFGSRVAWITAVLMAVTPWAVTLSRSAGPAVLATLLLPLTMVVAGRAIARGEVRWWWLTAGVFIIDLLSGPLGWTTAALLLCLSLVYGFKQARDISIRPAHIAPVTVVFVGTVAAITGAVWKHHEAGHFFSSGVVTSKLSTLATTTGKVAAMFNLHGDDNFLHNFNGQPMLNAFVGLMFVAGLLVAITRLDKRRYLAVVITFIFALIPALVSQLGAPNAAHAALALPVSLLLAGIGTGYMLDLWHATFPINSAARSTGLAAILLLLLLSVFQGYVQIFRAWSGSAETYLAYDEAAVAAAHYLDDAKATKPAAYTNGRYVVAMPDEQNVIAYLSYGSAYTAISANGISSIIQRPGSTQLIITASSRDEAARMLALSLPGGKLVPHYSAFSQNELFYNYEISK